MALPPDLSAYLAQHWMLVTRRRLIKVMGYAHGQVAGWVRRGHLVEVHRGVYTTPCAPASYEHDVLAAVLRCGQGARAGPRASLRLLAVTGFTVEDEEPPDVAVEPGRRLTGVEFTVVRSTVARADRMSVRGIPAIAGFPSLVLIAHEEETSKLRVGFDCLRRRNLTSLTQARTRLPALADLPGARILAELVDAGDLEQESEGERDLLKPFLLEAFPHEVIEWQVEDLAPGRRFDAAIRRVSFAFEWDSRDHHTLPTDWDADQLRRLQARADGVEVFPLTNGMVKHDRAETLAAVRLAFARREVELSRGTGGLRTPRGAGGFGGLRTPRGAGGFGGLRTPRGA